MNPNFNVNLITLRKSKGLEISDLAMILGTDEETVKKWEFGLETPALEMLEKISGFYGVTSSDLFLPMNVKITRPTKSAAASAAIAPANQESKGRFIAWHVLTSCGLALTVLILGLMALQFLSTRYDVFAEYGSYTSVSNYSFFNVAADLQDALSIVVLTTLLVVLLWDIVAFILHFVGRCKGDTYKYLNIHVSRTLQYAGAILLFALSLTFVLDNRPQTLYIDGVIVSLGAHAGYYLFISFISVLTVLKIAAVSMLKWRTK